MSSNFMKTWNRHLKTSTHERWAPNFDMDQKRIKDAKTAVTNTFEVIPHDVIFEVI